MGLRENILNHPVSQLELRPLIAVEPAVTVRNAIEQMRQNRLGCVVVVEGAGSCAEVNLRDRDLVNFPIAHHADAPVLLGVTD